MEIVTNNQERDILYWHDLTEKEKEDFDYLDTEERQIEANFFRYKKNVYDLGEFVVIVHKGNVGGPFGHHDLSGELKDWQGIQTESFHSAIVVRYTEDMEGVVVGLVLT